MIVQNRYHKVTNITTIIDELNALGEDSWEPWAWVSVGNDTYVLLKRYR